MDDQYLKVKELSHKAIQGQTAPWHCKLSDDKSYYIKGKDALHSGLIIEFLCAELGRNLGLPIPNSTIAYLETRLIKYNEEAQDSFGSEGCHVFASEEVSNLVELKYSDLSLVEPELAKLIFFFDFLIRNEDRTLTETGGNPNLFIDPLTKKLTVIDHNLAFDSMFDFSQNKQIHAFSSFWFDTQLDLLFKQDMLKRLPEAIKQLEEIAKTIPESWIDNSNNIIETIFTTLNLYKAEEFWEALK